MKPNPVKSSGKVVLIGAGPGDPDLLTVRGMRYLMQADVVLYDRLIDPRLLSVTSSTARLIDVGKRYGQSHLQTWIEQLLIAEAQKGLHVVRLKSGDPFVFGRGGEEVEALIRAGVDYEVVPGLSTAISVPAIAGIPVLHRNHAHGVAIVSGHRLKPDELTLWAEWLKHSTTLVILMGMSNLPYLMSGLHDAGVPASCPVAVTRTSGAGRTACTRVGTLTNIAEVAAEMSSPAVIVVGDVVAWKRWCDTMSGENTEVTASDVFVETEIEPAFAT